MKRGLFFIMGLVILLFIPMHPVFPQSRLDSLEKIVADYYRDSLTGDIFHALSLLSEYYRYKNPAKSIEYSTELKEIAYMQGNLQYAAEALRHIGNTYSDLGIYYLAYENYYNELEIYKELDDKVSIAYALNNIGFLNYKQGLCDMAIEHYMQALAYISEEKIKQKQESYMEAVAYTYCNIAEAMANQNRIDTSLYFSTKALELRKAGGDLVKIGVSLNCIGKINRLTNDVDGAIDNFQKAEKLFEIENHSYQLAVTYKLLGDAYRQKQQYELAQEYYQKSLEIFIVNENRFQVINMLTTIGKLHVENDCIEEAENITKRVVELSKKGGFLIQQRDVYKLLSEIYFLKGDYKTALENFKDYTSLLDSLYSSQVIQTMTRIEVLNETEIKEKEIAIQKLTISRKNVMLIGLIVVIMLMIIVVIVLIRRHDYVQKTSKIIHEQQHKIYSQQKKIMEQKEESLKKELEYKNQEITYKTMNLLQVNEYYLQLIDNLVRANEQHMNPEISSIIRDMRNKIKTEASEKTWQEFEILFTQLHQDFFGRLNSEYPDLTINEKRLCSFLRLNMTTKDISTITGQSIRSIEIARTRLRKKLILKPEDNLVNFILSF